VPIPVEQILEKISEMGILDTLKYLVSLKIVDFGIQAYSTLKEKIHRKWELYYYAIVPNKKEALILEDLGKHPDYQTVISLIPKHRYKDTIRTGLLIRSYMIKNDEQSKERCKEIKLMVARRPDGTTLMKMIHLTTTPYFGLVLRYLSHQKQNGYTERQLLEEFDSIITEWDDEQYLPVKSKYTITQVKRFCMKNIMGSRKKFFLIGMNVAAEKIEGAITDLKKLGSFRKGGYVVTTSRDEDPYDHSTKVEVVVRKKNLLDKVLDDV